MAVVIVEAGDTSGALITAEFAVEQDRDVFAVPGQVFVPQSKGTNRLIANGAKALLQPADVLEALDLTRHVERREIHRAVPSDATEAMLLDLLGAEPEACGRSSRPTGTAHRENLRCVDDDGTQGYGAAGGRPELCGGQRRTG
jgi:DNA processing protein